MRPFRHLSIKWKLKLIIMLTSGIALLFAAGTLMYSNVVTSRKIIRDDLSSLARVIGANSIGAIVFYDRQTAENNLSALRAKPDVALACIYDRKGEIFATFVHEDAANRVSVPAIREPGHYYEGNYLLVYSTVQQWNDVLGTVLIQFDLKGTQEETLHSAAIFGLILGVAFLIIWVLSYSLQKVISKPILSLTRIARMVSEKKDFSVRAEKHAPDEIGVLIDVFNGMLARIQSRDEKLREYREHLEEQVANRTVELRQANQLLRTAKEAAESANRAKSEFLANMSHEIRTPMNTVLGFADLLTTLITDKKQKSYLAAISSSGKGLLTLINGILDLSKIEAGKMDLEYEPVNPFAIFDEIRHIFALQAAEKKIEFNVRLDPDIPNRLMLDEVRLKQILFNLIGNAVKFTESGFVHIEVDRRPGPQDPAAIGMMITVEDSGIGIPTVYHAEIFEAFKQKDGQSTKRFGGTGLGLSITKRLVDMMEGTISVQSEPKRGSRFSIVLPHVRVAPTDSPAMIEDAFDAEGIVFEDATVMVADDMATNRLLIKAFFGSTAITPIEAVSGEDAVRMARKQKPDLILMDLIMPGLNGVEAMKQLAGDPDTRSIPIVALTASGIEGEKERMLDQGFAGYLSKPIQKATLFQELIDFIPHTTVEKKASLERTSDPSPIDPECLSCLIEELESTYMHTWRDARKNRFFNEIGQFANQMSELGRKNAVTVLASYGDTLNSHVERFDVENMTTTLNAFPEILETVRSLGREPVKEANRGAD